MAGLRPIRANLFRRCERSEAIPRKNARAENRLGWIATALKRLAMTGAQLMLARMGSDPAIQKNSRYFKSYWMAGSTLGSLPEGMARP